MTWIFLCNGLFDHLFHGLIRLRDQIHSWVSLVFNSGGAGQFSFSAVEDDVLDSRELDAFKIIVPARLAKLTAKSWMSWRARVVMMDLGNSDDDRPRKKKYSVVSFLNPINHAPPFIHVANSRDFEPLT